MKKLKSVTAFRTNLTSFAGDDSADYKYYHREMNEAGNPIHVVYYSKNGEERLVEDFKYDEKGRVIEEVNNHIDEERLEKNTWKYDDRGNIIEEGEYYEDELYEKTIHEYDANNRKISTKHLDPDDNILDNNMFEYNSEGKLLKHSHINENGEPDWEMEMKYNDEGKTVLEIKRSLPDGGEEITAHSYNEKGERIGSETKSASGEVIHLLEEEYDELGNHLETISKSRYPYMSHNVRTTEYDEEGRAIASQVYDEQNKYMLSREIIEYGEDGHPETQEIYELRASSGMTKTHFLLTFDNIYRD